MGDIVNLRQARKRKGRADKALVAAANRARFGRTREQKARDLAEEARRVQALDGHRREEADPD